MTPIRHSYLKWGDLNQQQVDGEIVPEGEVWLIQYCGLGTQDNRVLDYMMQIVVPPGWYMPLFREETAGSTPVLAVNRSFILQSGEYLRSRVNAPADFAKMVLLYSGWIFPDSALPQLLGVGATSSGGTSVSPSFAITLQGSAVPQS